MDSHYQKLLNTGRCWCSFATCPMGKEFLKDLYSWDNINNLNPFLVNSICVNCENY